MSLLVAKPLRLVHSTTTTTATDADADNFGRSSTSTSTTSRSFSSTSAGIDIDSSPVASYLVANLTMPYKFAPLPCPNTTLADFTVPADAFLSLDDPSQSRSHHFHINDAPLNSSLVPVSVQPNWLTSTMPPPTQKNCFNQVL